MESDGSVRALSAARAQAEAYCRETQEGAVSKSKPTNCLYCEKAGVWSKRGEGVRIVFDPGIQMPGTPTIEGHRLAAEHMARVYYEQGWGMVTTNWRLTHEELITACWWAAHWGPRKLKQAWEEWGVEAGHHLWYGCINVSLPPTRAEIEAGQ